VHLTLSTFLVVCFAARSYFRRFACLFLRLQLLHSCTTQLHHPPTRHHPASLSHCFAGGSCIFQQFAKACRLSYAMFPKPAPVPSHPRPLERKYWNSYLSTLTRELPARRKTKWDLLRFLKDKSRNRFMAFKWGSLSCIWLLKVSVAHRIK